MRVPDLEYLIDEAAEKQMWYERAMYAEQYYYAVEIVRAAIVAPNRRELHVMEKDARKARELKKLKSIIDNESS